MGRDSVPLNILEHPAVVRLLAGENIQVQELREALVEFWEENGTFDICRNDCAIGQPRSRWPLALGRGCCRSCESFVVGQGRRLRNLACLLHTCGALTKRLEALGLEEDFQAFRKLLPVKHGCRGGLDDSAFCGVADGDAFFNRHRLPDQARLYIVDDDRHGVTITTNTLWD
jgi:hypothetical protein